MRRSTRFSGLVVVMVGVAVWVGLPTRGVHAQVPKVSREAVREGKGDEGGKSLPKVSILRLHVVNPEPPQPEMAGRMFARAPRFGFEDPTREGTSLVLLIDEPQQWILSLENKDFKINKFRDDRNTDLTLTKKRPEDNRPVFNRPIDPEECSVTGVLDPAGHRATVTVHSPQLPITGAKELSLDLDLVMTYGHGERTVEQKNVNLMLDKITAGPSPLVIMSQGGADQVVRQGQGMQVMLFHQGPLREFKKVSFFAPDGEEIKATANGSGQNGYAYQTYYSLTKKVETCTVRLTVPDTIETVALSVSINTGVGFPPSVRRRIRTVVEPKPTAPGGAPH